MQTQIYRPYMMPKHSHSMTNVKFTTMPIRAGKETQVNGRWKGCLSLGFFEFGGRGRWLSDRSRSRHRWLIKLASRARAISVHAKD